MTENRPERPGLGRSVSPTEIKTNMGRGSMRRIKKTGHQGQRGNGPEAAAIHTDVGNDPTPEQMQRVFDQHPMDYGAMKDAMSPLALYEYLQGLSD